MERTRTEVTLTQRTAAEYVARGWSVVPVPFRSKCPVASGWQQLRIAQSELGQYFSAGQANIGVLLGAPSCWLVDADLDHPLALELAAKHLPPTGAVFGRASKRRSHWLYYSTRPVSTRQWRLPNRKMVVELRSTGAQTIFPGSVHTEGERIEWNSEGEPAIVDPDVIQAGLQAIYDEVCRKVGGLPGAAISPSVVATNSAPNSVLVRAEKYLAKLPPAISGQGGHSATFHAACVLVLGFGLDQKQALAVLRRWNKACQPPWSERELEHKVADALKQPGWRGYLLSPRRRLGTTIPSAIDRANRHAIEHRRRSRRRVKK